MNLPNITLNESTNCSSLIAKLILDHFMIPEVQQQLHLLTGMGHGAEVGSICGGLSGGLFAINFLLNRYGANDDEIEDAHGSFRFAFLEKFGAINCSDIIDLHFEDNEFESRQARFCGNLLDQSTEEAIEIINLVAAVINPISNSMNRH